jgi:hypothetical protein
MENRMYDHSEDSQEESQYESQNDFPHESDEDDNLVSLQNSHSEQNMSVHDSNFDSQTPKDRYYNYDGDEYQDLSEIDISNEIGSDDQQDSDVENHPFNTYENRSKLNYKHHN